MNTRNDQINALMDADSAVCISIYLDPGNLGAPVDGNQSKIRFKNNLAEVENELTQRGYDVRETAQLLKPGFELIENAEFWEGLSPGLGVFLADGQLTTVSLDEFPQPSVSVGSQMYVLPLLPSMHESSRFFLLSLSLGDADLFVGNRSGLQEIALEDLGPQSLKEALGSDYEQKFLQFRAGQTGQAEGAVFHGHGEGKDEHKTEIAEYFRLVNKSLREILQGETAPLVVACVDYLFPIYQKVNTYKNLADGHLSGNPEREPTAQLHEKALALLGPVLSKERKAKAERFKELYDTDNTTWDIKEIVREAFHGRIDTLFIKKGEDVFGSYNPTDRGVTIDQHRSHSNTSLLDLAARHAVKDGGRVFILEEADLPLPDQNVCALLR